MGFYPDNTIIPAAIQDDWIDQALRITASESAVLRSDSLLDAIAQPTTTSDTNNAMEDTNWLVDAVRPSAMSAVVSAVIPGPESHSYPMQTPIQCPSPRASSNPIDVSEPQVPHTLNDYSTILVEYYFKDTAPILALYDSNMNPFRSTVSRLWCFSEIMYFTLQSMSAALLSNIYPQMSYIGMSYREKAISLIHALDQAAIDETVLVALFMVGGTASWFDSNDTGVQYFMLVREHIQRMTACGQMSSSGTSPLFFKELLTCWEMFLAFVVDDDKLGPAQPSSM